MFRTSTSTSLLLCGLGFVLGSVRAVECGPGTFQNTDGQCAYCAPGTYRSGSKAVPSCQLADPGFIACGPEMVGDKPCFGAVSQQACEPGTYADEVVQAACKVCPAGSICPGPGQAIPEECRPGYFMPDIGSPAPSCLACEPGTFNSLMGATKCCSCCAGTYSPNAAATECFSCWANTRPHSAFSPPGTSTVSKCQPNHLKGMTPIGNIKHPLCAISTKMGPDGNYCPAVSKEERQTKTAETKCPKGTRRCPVYTGLGGFECMDIMNDPENCGGCVAVEGIAQEKADGRDCTAISNVNIVGCVSGTCAIESCRPGYIRSEDRSTCILDPTQVGQQPLVQKRHMHHHHHGHGISRRHVHHGPAFHRDDM